MTRGGKRKGAGRPKDGDGSTASLHIRIPLAKLEAYRQAAVARGVSVTDLVQTAVDALIAG